MKYRYSLGHQTGRFLLGWLLGVAAGAGVIGIGLFFGFSYLSDMPSQPMTSINTTPQPTPSQVVTVQRGDPPASTVVEEPVDRTEQTVQPAVTSVSYRPKAAAAPPSTAVVRTRDGEVLEVGDGETIDMVLDRHARQQNLSVAIDRAVSRADRAERVPADIVRQQQEQIVTARTRAEEERMEYEEQLREDDANRRELMREEDQRRGLDIEPDPDEEGEIAPRIPD